VLELRGVNLKTKKKKYVLIWEKDLDSVKRILELLNHPDIRLSDIEEAKRLAIKISAKNKV